MSPDPFRLDSKRALVTGAGRGIGRAVALDPGDAALRYNRAFALQSAGRWDEALVDLDVATDLAPDDPEISAAHDLCLQRVAA